MPSYLHPHLIGNAFEDIIFANVTEVGQASNAEAASKVSHAPNRPHLARNRTSLGASCAFSHVKSGSGGPEPTGLRQPIKLGTARTNFLATARVGRNSSGPHVDLRDCLQREFADSRTNQAADLRAVPTPSSQRLTLCAWWFCPSGEAINHDTWVVKTGRRLTTPSGRQERQTIWDQSFLGGPPTATGTSLFGFPARVVRARPIPTRLRPNEQLSPHAHAPLSSDLGEAPSKKCTTWCGASEIHVALGGPRIKLWSQIVCLSATGWGRQAGRQTKGRQEAALDEPS